MFDTPAPRSRPPKPTAFEDSHKSQSHSPSRGKGQSHYTHLLHP